jgi:hypothetical protein
MAGVATAITNASYHPIGVRGRQLPIRLETLMQREKTPSYAPDLTLLSFRMQHSAIHQPPNTADLNGDLFSRT